MPQPRTVLQIVTMNNEGDSAYRMCWPAQHLAQQRKDWRIINLDTEAAERYEWGLKADLLVLYQQSDPDMLRLVRERRKRGLQTLAEYNDNFYAPPAASPAASAWRSPMLWRAYERLMQAADGLIVTGPGLAELLRPQAENITIVPNYLPTAPPEFKQRPDSEGGAVRFGWAGSIGHVADILSLKRIIEQVLIDFPDSTFCLMGNTSLPGELGLPQARVNFTPWGDMDAYYRFLDDLDVGLAPLLDTDYNRCRSDVKALELAGRSVTPILPDSLPYREFVNKTGIVAYSTPQELDSLLREYMRDAVKRRADGSRCHAYVTSERVGPLNTQRAQLYERHFPPQSPEFNWPVAAGYHEVKGRSQPQGPHGQAMAQLNKLYAGRQFGAVLEQSASLAERYPDDPDLFLLQVRTLSKTAPAQALEKVEQCVAKFPGDLRFVLSKAILLKDSAGRRACWEELLGRLRAAGEHERDFYRAMLLRNLISYLQKSADPDFAEQFVELYPDAADLRYQLWREHEAAGNDAAAQRHCDWLLTMHRALRHAAETLKDLNPEYLMAWNEGLKGRLPQA